MANLRHFYFPDIESRDRFMNIFDKTMIWRVHGLRK